MMIDHIVKECYFIARNLLLLQCVDIPMGIYPAPFWENLYLYDYEASFISNLIKTHKPRAIKFKNASRFFRDERNSNYSDWCSKSFHVIFPNKLGLKREHNGLQAAFLDRDISVVDSIYK